MSSTVNTESIRKKMFCKKGLTFEEKAFLIEIFTMESIDIDRKLEQEIRTSIL